MRFGPVEVAHQLERLSQAELRGDVAAHLRRRRRGVRLDRHVGPQRAQLADAPVLGPEVVAPVADAVRLVHHQAGEAEPAELGEEARLHQALRRHEQQLHRAAREPLVDLALLAAVLRARQHRRLDAALDEARELVLHQRDQRTDHDGEAVAQQRGRLVAEALAAAGREHDERVAARERGEHGLGLERPQLRVAPHPAHHRAQLLEPRGLVPHHHGATAYQHDASARGPIGGRGLLRREESG